jgi:hypothetical protein
VIVAGARGREEAGRQWQWVRQQICLVNYNYQLSAR